MGVEQETPDFGSRFKNNFINLAARSGIAATTLVATEQLHPAERDFTNIIVVSPVVGTANYLSRAAQMSVTPEEVTNSTHYQVESGFVGFNVPVINFILTSEVDMTLKAIGIIGLVTIETLVLSI